MSEEQNANKYLISHKQAHHGGNEDIQTNESFRELLI